MMTKQHNRTAAMEYKLRQVEWGNEHGRSKQSGSCPTACYGTCRWGFWPDHFLANLTCTCMWTLNSHIE